MNKFLIASLCVLGMMVSFASNSFDGAATLSGSSIHVKV